MVSGKKSILIVDDSQDIHDLLGSILKNEGFESIHHASSGEEAIRLLGINDPDNNNLDVDIILMDIVMPGIDGIETLRAIKARKQYCDVPVVMVTRLADVDYLKKSFEAGALDYIVKPANEVEFVTRVRSFLKLKSEMDLRRARGAELLEATMKLRKANATLERLSYIDALTGVGNRRYFDELYLKEWKRARREESPLALMLIDIDFFKAYNDFYGHQAGDLCLSRIAEAIATSLKRPVDFAARYGGEEFAVVLPHTDVEGARIVAANVIKAVHDLKINHGTSMVGDRVTVSAGLAALVPGREDDPDALLHAADSALYRAKESGRNRLEIEAL